MTHARAAQDTADGFVEGGAAYLDAAMAWGEQYGIGILLELHAANGSQNGYDHSAPVKSGARCLGSCRAAWLFPRIHKF